MVDTFRYFIRKNFPSINGVLSNKDIDAIGIEFNKYLDSKLNEEQKERILPKNAMEVIINSDHPLKVNGFDPAYILHFRQWIKKQSKTDVEDNSIKE